MRARAATLDLSGSRPTARLDDAAIDLAEQVAADAAIARLAPAVHQQVLGGVQAETERVLVLAEEGEVLLHLGDLLGR